MESQGMSGRQLLVKKFKPTDTTIFKTMEDIPETVTHASYVPKPLSKLVRCGPKHLEEGFPTIKGDPRTFNFTTHYKDIFKKHLHQRVQPVRKHYSTVIIGDPEKGSETKTIYGESYPYLNLSSFHKQPKKKDNQVLNPSDVFNGSWISTFKDDFRGHKVDLQGISSQDTSILRATSDFQPKLSVLTEQDFPISMTHASFIPHPPSKLVKPKVSHLEEGFPTIRGDLRALNFLSQYKDTFRRHFVQPIELAERHYSSVCMGDPAKSSEKQTSYSSAFPQISVNSPTKPIRQDELRRRYDYKNDWATSFREDFKPHRVEPIVQVNQVQKVSSLPFDKERSAEDIPLTTNNIFYSSKGSQLPISLPDLDLITKSNVYFGPESESKESYKKTEERIQQAVDQPKPVSYPKSYILTGPDLEPKISMTMADFKPKKITQQPQCESQRSTNFKFPLSDMSFSTNYKDDYIVRPLFPPPTPFDQRHSNVKLR
ncbi:uncharacterized protein si:ch211-198o12.4 isoform X2 [Poeciliopsis prolifica]|uniref:uncharacterized protein si:ch211-198o12.4 isoform X2 n=1 Tax=Poeciliopsis prolifica TaxID=188132 RepID=UPI002413AEF7|nr:uncharacterized protein si:ch211-198o12.4 isoform X2 [Poeciliopsis prolifica]